MIDYNCLMLHVIIKKFFSNIIFMQSIFTFLSKFIKVFLKKTTHGLDFYPDFSASLNALKPKRKVRKTLLNDLLKFTIKQKGLCAYISPLTIAIRSFMESLAWSIFPSGVRATCFNPKDSNISSSDTGFSSSVFIEVSSSLLLLLLSPFSWFLIIFLIFLIIGVCKKRYGFQISGCIKPI